jgi:hypothetical protein
MQNFNHITNWKLLSGSHDFPGPDGGTCINEAAIVAAGFEYKKVTSVNDCPPCFSRPIAAYAIKLNDNMPETLRQELLIPFVTRLSETADSLDVERKRAQYMAIQTVNRILPIVARERLKREDLALRCEAASTLQECREAAQSLRAAAAYADADAAYAAAAAAAYAAYAAAAAAAYAYADAAAAAAYADAAAYAAYAAAAAAAYAYADAAYAAAAAAAAAYADAAAAAADAAAYAAAYAAAATRRIFIIAAEILDGAIKLGNQAKPVDTAIIVKRLEDAKAKVAA